MNTAISVMPWAAVILLVCYRLQLQLGAMLYAAYRGLLPVQCDRRAYTAIKSIKYTLYTVYTSAVHAYTVYWCAHYCIPIPSIHAPRRPSKHLLPSYRSFQPLQAGSRNRGLPGFFPAQTCHVLYAMYIYESFMMGKISQN